MITAEKTCSSLLLVLMTTWAAPAQELPSPPTEPRLLEFTGPEEGWPPQVKGATDVRILEPELAMTGITPAFAERLRELLSASPEMRPFLGERFAFVGAEFQEETKDEDLRPAEQRLVAATFYSYSRNVAVRALVRSGDVLEVRDVEGYQPPESPEEIKFALELARADERLRAEVQDLEGTAMLTERGEGQEGSGNRVFYVSFAPPGRRQAEYFALVDLTEARVIDAGRPAGG